MGSSKIGSVRNTSHATLFPLAHDPRAERAATERVGASAHRPPARLGCRAADCHSAPSPVRSPLVRSSVPPSPPRPALRTTRRTLWPTVLLARDLQAFRAPSTWRRALTGGGIQRGLNRDAEVARAVQAVW